MRASGGRGSCDSRLSSMFSVVVQQGIRITPAKSIDKSGSPMAGRGRRMGVAGCAETVATHRSLEDGVGAVGGTGHGMTVRRVIRHVVPLGLEDGVFPDALADGLFQPGRFEQGRAIGDPRDGLIRLEDSAGHAHVNLLACFEVEA